MAVLPSREKRLRPNGVVDATGCRQLPEVAWPIFESQSMQSPVDQNTEFKLHTFWNSQPVELLQQRCHVITSTSAVDQPRSGMEDRLQTAELVSRQTSKDCVAVSPTIVIRVPRQVVWKGSCDRDRRRLCLSIRRRPWWCGQTWWVRYRSKLPGHERWMTELPQTRKWLTLWVVERSDVESCTTGSRSWLRSTVVDWRLFTWRCHRHKLTAGSLKSHHIRRWTEAVNSSVTAYTSDGAVRLEQTSCARGRPPQYVPTPASWPLTFWPFDCLSVCHLVSESRVTWATYVPMLVFLGLSVLDLGLMCATDRRHTSDAHHRLMPLA